MKFNNTKLGVTIELPPILQRDLEAYYRAVREFDVADPLVVEAWRASIEAARSVGWLNGTEDVGLWEPRMVRFYAECITEALTEATAIPKD